MNEVIAQESQRNGYLYLDHRLTDTADGIAILQSKIGEGKDYNI